MGEGTPEGGADSAVRSPNNSTVTAQYDSFATVPEYEGLRTAIESGRWSAVDDALALLRPEALGFALTSLAEQDGIEHALEDAVAADPHSASARTALAMRYSALAWASRSRGAASTVSEEQFALFRDGLVRSEQLLLLVCAEHPAYAPAWAARLPNARGLQLGTSEARRRYRHHAALSPHDFPAPSQLLQYILPKWFGSDDEAAAFVTEATLAAPDGSNSHALVPLLHLERWVELGNDRSAETYFTRADVIAEVRAAAGRSVLHADHELDAVGVQAHSTFLLVFYLGDHYEEAERHLDLLDGRVSEFPWRYALSGPKELPNVYEHIRTHVDGAA